MSHIIEPARTGRAKRRGCKRTIDEGELAPSARARCRSCKQAIARNEWRVSLEFFEEGMFNPSGYLHIICDPDFFGTRSFIDPITWFCPDLDLDAEAIHSIRQSLEPS